MSEAEATLEVQDPSDSLDATEQEPGDVEGEPSSDEAQPDDDAAAADEAAAGQPAGDDDEPGEPAESIEADPVPPEAAEAPSPFSFRVDGVPVDVEGATVADEVVTIPKDSWDRIVQPRLADRGKIGQRETRMQQRIKQLETESAAEVERAKLILERVDGLLSDPAKLQEFAAEYELRAPQFKLEIENELLKSQNTRSTERIQTIDQQAAAEQFNETARPGLDQAVQMVLSENELDIDRGGLVDHIWGLWDKGTPVFFKVQEGDGSGLDPREHEYGINLDLVRTLVQPTLTQHQKSEAAKRAAEVKAKNAKALADAPPAPPTAETKGSPVPGGESSFPQTAEEYAEWKKERGRMLNLPLG